jgi:CrcB protein
MAHMSTPTSNTREMNVMTILMIALGGAAGSVSRYGLGMLVQRGTQAAFPVGTLTVNLVGCVIAGVAAKILMGAQANPDLRALVIVGFCGGFTTFSAFSLEVVGLAQRGEWLLAAGYVAASLVLCLAGTAIGFAMWR